MEEITPLSDKDCFHVVDRHKSEFTYPLHQHREYELNFVENAPGVRRVVGDSVETIGNYDLVLICSENLEHVWDNGDCTSHDIREVTIQFSPDLLSGSLMARMSLNNARIIRNKTVREDITVREGMAIIGEDTKTVRKTVAIKNLCPARNASSMSCPRGRDFSSTTPGSGMFYGLSRIRIIRNGRFCPSLRCRETA